MRLQSSSSQPSLTGRHLSRRKYPGIVSQRHSNILFWTYQSKLRSLLTNHLQLLATYLLSLLNTLQQCISAAQGGTLLDVWSQQGRQGKTSLGNLFCKVDHPVHLENLLKQTCVCATTSSDLLHRLSNRVIAGYRDSNIIKNPYNTEMRFRKCCENVWKLRSELKLLLYCPFPFSTIVGNVLNHKITAWCGQGQEMVGHQKGSRSPLPCQCHEILHANFQAGCVEVSREVEKDTAGRVYWNCSSHERSWSWCHWSQCLWVRCCPYIWNVVHICLFLRNVDKNDTIDHADTLQVSEMN